MLCALTFLLLDLFIYDVFCLYLCMWTIIIYAWCPRMSEWGIRSSGTGFRRGCAPSCGCWEWIEVLCRDKVLNLCAISPALVCALTAVLCCLEKWWGSKCDSCFDKFMEGNMWLRSMWCSFLSLMFSCWLPSFILFFFSFVIDLFLKGKTLRQFKYKLNRAAVRPRYHHVSSGVLTVRKKALILYSYTSFLSAM